MLASYLQDINQRKIPYAEKSEAEDVAWVDETGSFLAWVSSSSCWRAFS